MDEDKNDKKLKLNILFTPKLNNINNNKGDTVSNDSESAINELIDVNDQKANVDLAIKHGLANRIYKINYTKIRETGNIGI